MYVPLPLPLLPTFSNIDRNVSLAVVWVVLRFPRLGFRVAHVLWVVGPHCWMSALLVVCCAALGILIP